MNEISYINILNKFTSDFCNIVNKHCNYVIVSGFVSIATGRSRGTEDIDIIIERLSKEDFIKLHNDLSSIFESFETDDCEEIYSRLKENSNIRYVYKNSLIPNMELKFSKDELDEVQLNNKIKIPLTGLDIFFNEIECNIAFKETILTSEKDMEDSKHLRLTFEEEISEKKISFYKDLINRCR